MAKKNKQVPEYDYRRLNELYEDTLKKTREGTGSPQESALGMAAAYAIDFIDTAKSIAILLDITARSEAHVVKVMTAVYYGDLMSGKDKDKCKDLLIKKFASYQLFSIVNSMNVEEKTVEIDLNSSVLFSVPKPKISTLPDGNGKRYTFDVYDAAEKTLEKFQFNKPDGDGALLFGDLSPFYQALERDLTSHL